MARMVQCAKLGKEAEGLDFPPLPGELGKRIYESVSKEAWQGWLKQQTMLINENRLNMADPRASQYLMKQTEKYFFGEGADQAAVTCRRRRADAAASGNHRRNGAALDARRRFFGCGERVPAACAFAFRIAGVDIRRYPLRRPTDFCEQI